MYSEKDFPQIEHMKKDKLIYLDSAATTLKHKSAVDEEYLFNSSKVSNVHRGVHRLSSKATTRFEVTREKTAKSLNTIPEQIVFTKGTTEGINLVAHHFEQTLTDKDTILLTEMEHHANIVPWQRVSKLTGAKLIYLSVDEKGELSLDQAKKVFSENSVRVFSFVHISNTLGTLNPAKELITLAKTNGAQVLLDGAQSFVSHRPNLKDLDPDYYVFSAHKAFGPFGLGVLYIKNPKNMKVYQLGGAMITEVSKDSSDYQEGALKFEAGTPNISAVLAFSKSLDFCETLDQKAVAEHSKNLLKLARQGLSEIKGFREFGTSPTKTGILSFTIDGIHANDLCELLDEQGLALRSGHHCTQPLLKKFNINTCARASFSIYNTESDVYALVGAVKKAVKMLR